VQERGAIRTTVEDTNAASDVVDSLRERDRAQPFDDGR